MTLGEFGDARLPSQTGESASERALSLGKHIGCPVAPRLIAERGADKMANRYEEILAYYGWAVEEVQRVRPDIATVMKGPLERLPGEPLADYDPDWIPKENLTLIPGPETPWGYALPRLITYYINDAGTSGSLSDRRTRALGYFDATLRGLMPHEGADTLLVKFAEKLVTEGKADAKAVLKNTISTGKLKQDTFFTYFHEIGNEMKRSAPALWGAYSSMTPSEKTVLHIANVA